jgi:phosphonate transport system permease protein
VSATLEHPPFEPIPAPSGRKRPPLPGLLPLVAVGAVLATIASAVYIDFNPATLLEGYDEVVALLERMLPPRLDDPGRIGNLAFETLLMAVLGTVLAAIASVPLAFLAARNTTPHPAVYAVARAVITFCRAMPDLLFAVLFVRALGIGVLPGILALAVHSIGMLGKLFADAIEQTNPGPREALRSTGVGYFREMINAVIPQVVPSWIGTFVYRIDINLRMSVVLGFVGAGGIGFALQDALRGLIYPRALGIVLVILVIIAAMELLAIWVRRMLLTPSASDPRRDRTMRFVFSALLIVTTIASLIVLEINPISLFTWVVPSLEVFGRMIPPNFDALGIDLAEAALQTVAIGVVSTAIGVVLSIPVGILAARNVTPNATVYWFARGWVLLVRAVPELILAVVFVAALGLGPIAGTCALAIASIGFLAKLVADAVEEIDSGPMEAVRSIGGGWWKVLFSAVIPQAMPSMVGSSLYMLDVNVRTSTILGIVGAGGIGYLLFESIRTLNFDVAGAIVLIIFVIVYTIERLSGWIRSRLV